RVSFSRTKVSTAAGNEFPLEFLIIGGVPSSPAHEAKNLSEECSSFAACHSFSCTAAGDFLRYRRHRRWNGRVCGSACRTPNRHAGGAHGGNGLVGRTVDCSG